MARVNQINFGGDPRLAAAPPIIQQQMAVDPRLIAALRMQEEGADASPANPLQGVARVGKSLLGALQARRLQDEYGERSGRYSAGLAEALDAAEPWVNPDVDPEAGARAQLEAPDPDKRYLGPGEVAQGTGGTDAFIARLRSLDNPDLAPLAGQAAVQQMQARSENEAAAAKLRLEQAMKYSPATIKGEGALAAARDPNRGLSPGYRWNADKTGQEIITGGAADPEVIRRQSDARYAGRPASDVLVRTVDPETGEVIYTPRREAAGKSAYTPPRADPLVKTLGDDGNSVYTPRSQAAGQRAPTTGGAGGLTATQQAQNTATMDARRRILAIQARDGIEPGQMYAMTQELDAYGRPNKAFRPELQTLLKQATRPLVGGDEGFEQFRNQAFGDAGQGAAGAPDPAGRQQGGQNPAVLLQQARDAIDQGADPAAVAARLQQYGVDPRGLQ